MPSQALGIPPMRLASGAGHDAVAMATLCPVAMLFVRCKGGISHNPAESIAEADADIAVRVLIEAVRRLAAQLDLAETARTGQPRRSADFS